LKKIIIISISILTFGFAGNSFAVQAEIPSDSTAVTAKSDSKITISGEIRSRGIVQQNTSDFNKNSTSSGSGVTVTTQKEQPRPKQ
jgi:hypothetical protein